ncbi:inositol monophosphatase [Actinocorallia longicatena]|uniref:Inositol monophosphatase family protein n=1 Tax=Actinocorallia longicatena TaxID=111803 RepID=A0ABP6QJZ0_9ACTN
MIDLFLARRVAVTAAEAAGAVLGPDAAFGVRAKGGDGDVVTDLDDRAEKIILGHLRAAFPGHAVLAEESGMNGSAGGPLWVVDPLDGTHNLTIGLPAYSVGVALCLDGLPSVGVIHDPVTRRTWSAVRGDGVRGLDPAQARPRPRPIVSWVQGYGVGPGDPAASSYKQALTLTSQRVLQLWAPQLTWIMLARGAIDGIVAYRTGAVDLPAGALIAAEAGVVLADLAGLPYDLRVEGPAEHSFVAARPERLPSLLAVLSG